MGKNFLKLISGIFLLIFFMIIYFFAIKTHKNILYLYILLGSCLFIYVYISFRIITFNKKLILFLNRVLEGDYKTGVKSHKLFNDEITKLEITINKTGDILRLYDDLRADKVALNYKSLMLVYNTIKEGLIISDTDKQMFYFNPIAQKIFDIDQEKFTFDSIEKHETNKDFVKVFRNVLANTKVFKKSTANITVPIRETQVQVNLRLFPVKDIGEKVRFILIFIEK